MTDPAPDSDHPLPEQQQQQQPRIRKRRRRTVACTQCRSRKLRCDREYPSCGRCQKSKTPTRCTYEDGFLWQQPNTVVSPAFSERGSTTMVQLPAHPTPDSALSSAPTRPQPSATGMMRREEKRDHFMETVLGAPKAAVDQEIYANREVLQRPRHASHYHHHHHHHREVSPHSSGDEDEPVSPSQQLDMSPRFLMRGRETKTRYNGSGIFANLIAQFPDIRSFAEDIRQTSPHLSALRPDLFRVKKGLWKKVPLNTPFPDPTTRSLIDMLPSRQVVDELVTLYFTYIESTHRILHVPSFLRELDVFWGQRDEPDLVSPLFVVQLLLVLACAWNLADFDTLLIKNEAHLACYTAVEWVLHTEKWIDNAQIKRPEIMALRVYILLIMAQNIHGMKRSKAWLATGSLLKQAMLAGFHRDPSKYTKISVFNKEMRRRIWATIVELDLQVALERGMVPSVQESDYDTAPPLNINDGEIQETSEELPADRPLTELTDSSFQSVLLRSLPLRLKACALMHSPRISCRYEEILRLDWGLNRYLSKVPSWSTANGEDFQTQHRMILVKALLETKIGHSLLSIHTPFAIEASRDSLFAPSARTRLEVAAMILSTQKRLQQVSRSLSLSILGDWTVQAYCSVCQLLHEGEGGSTGSSSKPLTRTLVGLSESLVSLAEAILTCLETRFLLVVKGAKEYFFMSTLLALAKVTLWPEQASVYKQEVVNRVLCFAQTLFSRHANCTHLGNWGMGNFKMNPIAASVDAGPGMATTPLVPDLTLLPTPGFGMPPTGELDPFLDAFDWADLTGITFE
ncbi:hypothetical protein FE257_000560 [Aspergillus nanangensis]|uniref:Zn(2)-C6 fungal-type domain-containing protein n=1 Tax=Aspergillus nanangensis TaxID=2582783 RepID=A0AAD4CW92_ASPNN|nr:hypothetical protein FE257_000560 [Aspergillus nanangensis]